jgi:hypothetical protein
VKDIFNGCKITKSKGKQYDIFVPASNKNLETHKIIGSFTSHFDRVIVSTKDACEVEDSKTCVKGLEITAIRNMNSKDQEFNDSRFLLDIISPITKKDRPMLKDSREIALY